MMFLLPRLLIFSSLTWKNSPNSAQWYDKTFCVTSKEECCALTLPKPSQIEVPVEVPAPHHHMAQAASHFHLLFCSQMCTKLQPSTHRKGGIGVNLVLGCYSEARVAVPGCPGKIHGRFQFIIHLLVNGAAKFCAIVPARNALVSFETASQNSHLFF